MSKLKIAIICGGPSSEHEVSCLSAGGVLKGLDTNSYEAILIGITKKGQWVALDKNYPLVITADQMPTIEPNDSTVTLAQKGLIINGQFVSIDCVFPVLHGEFGEDGKIQQLLDQAQLPYVGSKAQASALAMNKSLAKPLFAASGMKVAQGITVTKDNQELGSLTFPVFVKPASGGSSRGTHKVKEKSALMPALEDAFLYDETVLVEQAINGREIECAVIEIAGEITASVVGEIIIDPKFEFYDFEAKYLDNATTVKIPALIPDDKAAQIQDLAIKAFKVIGCSGLARCDFFYTETGEIIINEINTMPGFTQTSVYPKLCQASGIEYTQLITALIKSALV